jgi:hypothetical protein
MFRFRPEPGAASQLNHSLFATTTPSRDSTGCKRINESVQKLVGSRGDCDSCIWTADGFESLTEAGTKRPVVNCAADLQHQVGASLRPAHLLRLAHPAIDQEIRRTLRHRSPDTVSSGVVDQPGALATEIFVDLVERMPQFSGCRASGPMTALGLVEMHDLADAIEGLLGIFGLAVRLPPSQLQMNVESMVTVMLMVAATGLAVGMSQSCSPILSVWARNVSGLMPTSAGRRCVSTSAATRKGIRAERWARSRSNSGVDRQCDGQVTQCSM